MGNTLLCALISGNPEATRWDGGWLSSQLGAPWSAAAAEGATFGWSIGSVLGKETLVQSRPIVRSGPGELLADLLRPQAPCVLAVAASSKADQALQPVGLGRFQRWIGAFVEGDLRDVGASRASIADLPDFLARGQVDKSDRELVLLGVLGALHTRGALRRTFSDPEDIAAALQALDENLGKPKRLNVAVHDGRTLALLHRGGDLWLSDPPEELQRSAVRWRAGSKPTGVTLRGLFLHAEASTPPTTGSERIADGVYTVRCSNPESLRRHG